MKIVIAADSFKGSLTSNEVADAIAAGISKVLPESTFRIVEVADGGEGTASILTKALGGSTVAVNATDPLNRQIISHYGIKGKLAIIDIASASGITLVADSVPDPLAASSRGSWLMILDALNRGCDEFIIGLGGSATTDAGTGMLSALGATFYGPDGQPLPDGGGSLADLADIGLAHLDPRLKKCRFTVVTDVTNPLCGETGAAHVFSPQKGATQVQVDILDRGLRRWGEVVERITGKNVTDIPGAGAAGGIGAAMSALLNCRLSRGIETVLDLLGFDDIIAGADLVITGEGRIDRQTLYGKLPAGVLERAKKAGVPVAVIAGQVSDSDALSAAGFSLIEAASPNGMPVAEAMMPQNASRFVSLAASRLARTISHFK